MSDVFDYIIVGAGTAGSTLAARLSEDASCRVLVLEAGGHDRRFWLRMPIGYFKTIFDKRVTHRYQSEPCPTLNDRAMIMPRGRVVGGSSSINGLIYIRGQHEDFDDWADMGAEGWSYQDVLPHFRRIEDYDGPSSQYRGAHGPVGVSDLRNDNPACEAWLTAAQQAGLPYNSDFNADTTHGVGPYQLTLRGRWRESAATAYLHPARKRTNLSVEMQAQVMKLTFEGRRVTGLTYSQHGKTRQVRAAREVILCAGSIQTPQVLQLSGIGPASLLQKHGLTVHADVPEVGRNLQDHLQMRTMVLLSNPKESLNHQTRDPVALAKMGLQWLVSARGPLTIGAGQVGGAMCTSLATNDRPDIQLFVLPLAVGKPGERLPPTPGFTVSFWQCHPESRGHIAIRSTDPFDEPAIQYNYLQTPKDQQTVVEGLKAVRRIYQQPAFRNRWTAEVVPGADCQSDDEILHAIREHATTVYHPVGTCRMGQDDQAVVDPQLRVKAVSGLRIADASIMPKITAANTNAAVYMIAEKAADMIRHDQT